MIDKEKIILMTKIAQYKKNHIRKDRKITAYFIEDYVYINNFRTRLWITLMILFFIGIGAFRIWLKEIIFPTSIAHFMDVYIRPYLYPWIGLMIVYTIISTMVYSVKYKAASKRMHQYMKYVKQLKQYEKQSSNNEEAPNEI